MPKKLFLIDGSNHAFRVQFALPPQHTSDGFPTRALYGFTLLLNKMMNTYKPDYCVVSFDHGKSFRHELYAPYKGHRPEMPPDLKRQWPYLTKLVEGFGYTVLAKEGFEADDVIGSLAKQFASDEVEVFIVSSDKDFAQLVDPHIHLVDDMKGGKVLSLDAVAEKMGVPPDQVVALKGLSGDSSDNLPGVPGIGDKTAAKLLAEWGSFDAVLEAAAAGKIKGKRGKNLVEYADIARICRDLARIRTDLDLDVTLDDLVPKGIQEEALRELFERWEFISVANKLLPTKVGVDKSAYAAVTDEQGLDALEADLRAAGEVGVAVRISKGSVIGASFATADRVAYVPLTPRSGVTFEADSAKERVSSWLADGSLSKLVYGAKQMRRALAADGVGLDGIRGDLRLLDYVLVAHRRSHGLAEIAKRHLGHDLSPEPPEEPLMLDDVVSFAGERAQLPLLLHPKLAKRLTAGLRSVYEEIELPLVEVLFEMEQAGIKLDVERIGDIARDLRARVDEA